MDDDVISASLQLPLGQPDSTWLARSGHEILGGKTRLYLEWPNGDKLVIDVVAPGIIGFEFYCDSIEGWMLSLGDAKLVIDHIICRLDMPISELKSLCERYGTRF